MQDAYCHLKCLVKDDDDEDKLVSFIKLFLDDYRIPFYKLAFRRVRRC